MHVSEGAFFLWLWLKDLPIHSQELYERLKRRGVLVVPGHHFFFGLGSADEDQSSQWQHAGECIRVIFAMPDDIIQAGMEIIASEVKKAYAQA